MSQFDYDLFVIGAGSGGVRASRMASATGARVAVAEGRFLGGTCVNIGCVPKKLFVYGAHYAEDFEDARGYGWTVEGAKFDWPTLRDNKTKEIERLNGIYGNVLSNAGVELINGYARVVDKHTVEVEGKQFSAERILVAPGAKPFVPEFPGREHVITSDDAFYLEEFPRKVIVVGGGYIAVEFAGIFHGLGAETVLSYRKDLFLRGFDLDVRETLRDEMTAKGVDLRFNSSVTKVEKNADGTLTVTWGDDSTEVCDTVLYATGRVPSTGKIGLEDVGVDMAANGAIKVNDNFQSSVPSIYALGDVIDRMQLTPVALSEAMALVNHLYGDKEPVEMDYTNIATAVFSQPNIGTVGLTEEQARENYSNIKVFKSRFRHMKHTLSGREEKTFMKLVVDEETDKVLGCHMVGADAGEILQGLAVALKAGATKKIFDSTVGIHPTAAEEFVTMRS
ncbi:glutathione-disulfide reductase [Sansalvadorimonas sp. 2012CJ34-2]|uniref:Glutathione reductase n=1 Tax=Parendozoicomonas callyspongiae TaxID=2942213 RepID=A0ABT0PG07_9GAMM|nr:glutathione-disulfide reductase [Sansalvadorimonas sp. 2012CJ34-2]MCL6269458.1 glutathione-disulfide reductase [Sansalvadorimonas sp. 2012CJ34-2]